MGRVKQLILMALSPVNKLPQKLTEVTVLWCKTISENHKEARRVKTEMHGNAIFVGSWSTAVCKKKIGITFVSLLCLVEMILFVLVLGHSNWTPESSKILRPSPLIRNKPPFNSEGSEMSLTSLRLPLPPGYSYTTVSLPGGIGSSCAQFTCKVGNSHTISCFSFCLGILCGYFRRLCLAFPLFFCSLRPFLWCSIMVSAWSSSSWCKRSSSFLVFK